MASCIAIMSFWSVAIKRTPSHNKFLPWIYSPTESKQLSWAHPMLAFTDTGTMISCSKNFTSPFQHLSIEMADMTWDSLSAPSSLTGWFKTEDFQIAINIKDRLTLVSVLHTSSSCFFKSMISLRYLFRRASSLSTSLTFGVFFILLAVLANWKNILSWVTVIEQIHPKNSSDTVSSMPLGNEI